MAETINLEIGERVRKARIATGFSREELAELTGISALFLGFIECGQRGMSVKTLQRLCKAMNVSADYILLGKTEPDNSLRETIYSVIADMDEKYYPLATDVLNHFKKTVATVEGCKITTTKHKE